MNPLADKIGMIRARGSDFVALSKKAKWLSAFRFRNF